MGVRAGLVLAHAAVAAAAAAVNVSVDTDKVVFTVSDKFLSWTQDSGSVSRWASFRGDFWYNDTAIALAKQLGPSHLRFGGTSEDFMQYNFTPPVRSPVIPGSDAERVLNETILRGLVHFTDAAGWDRIFGANVGTYRSESGEWDPAAFEQLLDFVTKENIQMAGWELGNEPDEFPKHNFTVTPQRLAADFATFRTVLAAHGQKGVPVIGCDTATMSTGSKAYFGPFLDAAGATVDRATWHFYYGPGSSRPHGIPWQDFYKPATLDKFLTTAQRAVEASAAWRAGDPARELWIGETSSTYGGGTANASASFVAGFMWVDKLALAARLGHKVVCRQCFGHALYSAIGTDSLPNPDYYSALLWRRLVGTKVLAVAGDTDTGRAVRSYAMCAAGAPGAVVVIYLNTMEEPAELRVALPGPAELYQLTSYPGVLTSRAVLLNGRAMEVDPRTGAVLTPLTPEKVPAGAVTVAPVSYGYIVYPQAAAEACG